MLVGLLVSGCSGSFDCTAIGAPSGVGVDEQQLPLGATGQVCVVEGPCLAVPKQPGDFLGLDAEPERVTVRVEIDGRPVEELSARLKPVYPNGDECGAARYQLTLRLTAGASELS